LDEVLSRNLAVAVKSSEQTAADNNDRPTDMTQSQDTTTTDVQCLRQVTNTTTNTTTAAAAAVVVVVDRGLVD